MFSGQQPPDLFVLTTGAAIAAADSLDIPFRWPDDVFVEGFALVPSSGDPAHLAKLTLQVLDKDGDPLFSDGIVPQAISGLGMMGGLSLDGSGLPAMRPYPVQRPAIVNSLWRFTIANGNAVAVTPEFLVYFRKVQR